MSRLDKHVWEAVSPLLDRALDLEADRRADLLAEVWRDRPDLAAVLAQLLEDHDQLLASGQRNLLSDIPFRDSVRRSIAGIPFGITVARRLT